MNNTTPVDVLVSMREYLMAHGWIQGAYSNTDGQACLVGALNHCKVEGETQEVYDAVTEAYDIIEELIDNSVTAWNDTIGRTFNEVVELLDEAILVAKESL